MIGKVILKTLPPGTICTNGWDGGGRHRPACNYTGGHYCCLPKGHKGKCRCSCGSTSSTDPARSS